jgi:hypothetical protein
MNPRPHLVAVAVLLATAVRLTAATNDFPIFWHEKEKFVALRDVAAAYGSEATGPFAQRIAIQNQWNSLIFRTDSREVLVNNTLLWLHEPVAYARGRWSLREVDATKVIDPILRPDRYLGRMGYRVVVIDPGHGGQDIGARGARGRGREAGRAGHRAPHPCPPGQRGRQGLHDARERPLRGTRRTLRAGGPLGCRRVHQHPPELGGQQNRGPGHRDLRAGGGRLRVDRGRPVQPVPARQPVRGGQRGARPTTSTRRSPPRSGRRTGA